ncbi:hypothetical protein HA466_0234660 [Hirschfeldia incana]|nr:hypothetical protein HA466_0234660 [Hirschfeldia incana]
MVERYQGYEWEITGSCSASASITIFPRSMVKRSNKTLNAHRVYSGDEINEEFHDYVHEYMEKIGIL